MCVIFVKKGSSDNLLFQAGVAESCWAIEFFSEAAQAYKLNNPKAEVFNEVSGSLGSLINDNCVSYMITCKC